MMAGGVPVWQPLLVRIRGGGRRGNEVVEGKGQHGQQLNSYGDEKENGKPENRKRAPNYANVALRWRWQWDRGGVAVGGCVA